jgi:capsule synthesis protein PGA_cap
MNLWVAGDVCLAGEPEQTLPAVTDTVWDGLLPQRRATDVLIANLENALTSLGTPRPFKWANLRAAPESVRLLRGLDVAVLSNNHVSDFGEVGVNQTLETLALEGISAVGYGANLGAAASPLIVRRNGARLAVVAQCCPTTNGENYATHTTAGVPTLSVQLLRDQIAAARAQADAVIVYLHWGCEDAHDAVPDQVRLGRLAVRFGADAVVGCHGHVIQSYECYNGRWVFHGLGNFLFGPLTFRTTSPEGSPIVARHEQLPRNKESLIAQFELIDGRPGERLRLVNVQSVRFGEDFIARHIPQAALSFDLDAVNRRLARYAALHAWELQDEGEPVFQATVRNGILAYWYARPPIRQTDCSAARAFFRSARRNTRRGIRRLVELSGQLQRSS